MDKSGDSSQNDLTSTMGSVLSTSKDKQDNNTAVNSSNSDAIPSSSSDASFIKITTDTGKMFRYIINKFNNGKIYRFG